MERIPVLPADKRVQADSHELVINGRPLPLQGEVQKQDLARFQSKITLGDYSFDSDPLLSTYNISSLTGGIGNEHLKEGVDDETYWTGTLETRYPGQITLLPRTWEYEGPVASASKSYPLGDFPSREPSFWAAFDVSVARWDPITQTFNYIGALPTPPVGKGVEYEDLLYIPLGEHGYATIDVDGAISVDGTIHARAFCLWDNKLAVLTDEGYVRLKFTATPFEAENDNFRLPSSAVPRNLVVFVNQQGAPTIYIVTNTDVWAYGRDEEYLYRTRLQFPPHPDQGRASTNWRGESIYVSVGLGIHSYNGGVIGGMGPDGRYGLPSHLRGVITDLEPEYNAILCLIEGAKVGDNDLVQGVEISDPVYQESIRPFIERNAKSVLLRYTGYGWHPVWESPDAEGFPSWVTVSRADNNYLLWWGYAGKMYMQKLPVTFHNPKQGLRAGVNEFAQKGSLTTGWMDADMIAFDKLASHVEVLLDDPLDNKLAVGKVSIYYQIDNEPDFTHLGTAEHIGRTTMPFNVEESEGFSEFSHGSIFRRIRFRIDMESDHILRSPVLRSVMLKFIKVPLSQLSFQFTVDLTQAEQYKFQGPGELAEFIRSLASDDQFAELIHRGDAYRTRISQTQSTDQTGYDLRSVMNVSAVEVRMANNEWVS